MGKGLRFHGIRQTQLIIALLTVIQSGSILYMAMGLAKVISQLFAGSSLQEQSGWISIFLAAFAIRQLTNVLIQRISYRYAEKTGKELRRTLMEKLFRFGPRLAKSEGTGNLVTLVLDGFSQFRTFLELFLPRMMSTAITPIIVWVYILMQDWIAALILAVTMPILIAFMILLGLAAKKQMDRQWESYRVLSNHFVDSLRGLETLKMLGLSKRHSESIERVSDSYRSATMKTLRVAFLSSFALDFFTMLSVASVAVSLGIRLIEGAMLLEPALLVLILAPEYFLPVRMMGADYHATLKGKEAGKAIQDLIDEASKQDRTEEAVLGTGEELLALHSARRGAAGLAASQQAATDGQSGISSGAAKSNADQHSSNRPVLASSSWTWQEDSVLRLAQIGVKHQEEGPASIEDITLELTGKRRIGVIGSSGAGKSTLIDVLGGFLHPTSGSVMTAGRKLSTLGLEGWREQITYIPQQPYLFSSTLRENVGFYDPKASEAEIKAAIAKAGLAEVAAGLPEGLDTPIGSGGRRLSGGQEQRVALARAFLGNRPIMLLDEPTAHLDIETEYELKQTMLPLFDDKLVILATHRLHWMLDMDMIIVMDHGRIAEMGTHEELLAKNGVYTELIRAQEEGWT